MGKNRRRNRRNAFSNPYAAIGHGWRHDMESQQQDQHIDQEQQQRQRYLHFICIRRLPGESDDKVCNRFKAYCSETWGHVVSATLQASDRSSPVDLLVEMESVAAAQQVLQARQCVLFDNRRQRKETLQQALPAPENIGHLRSSACWSCRGNTRTSCSCPRYCKVFPARTNRNKSHKAAEDEVVLNNVAVQVGSVGPAGPDGMPTHKVEGSSSSCKVSLDRQERALVIGLPLERVAGSTGSEMPYQLHIRFRHIIRSVQLNKSSGLITFTTKQPPKVLRSARHCSRCGQADGAMLDDLFGSKKSPDWELSLDPTAPGGIVSREPCTTCNLTSFMRSIPKAMVSNLRLAVSSTMLDVPFASGSSSRSDDPPNQPGSNGSGSGAQDPSNQPGINGSSGSGSGSSGSGSSGSKSSGSGSSASGSSGNGSGSGGTSGNGSGSGVDDPQDPPDSTSDTLDAVLDEVGQLGEEADEGVVSANSATHLVGSGLCGADGILGRCLTFRMQLDDADAHGALSNTSLFKKKLRSYKLLGDSNTFSSQEEVTADDLADNSAALQTQLHELGFQLQYWVHVLLTGGIITSWQAAAPPFLQKLQQLPPDLARQVLQRLHEGGHPVSHTVKALQQIVGASGDAVYTSSSSEPSLEDGARLFQVLRVHVSPTRVKYLPPEIQTGHRVIRHFSSTERLRPEEAERSLGQLPAFEAVACLNGLMIPADHFLRVSFGDESCDKLFNNPREPIDAFYTRMETVMKQGLTVCGRHYMFLAYSCPSQLKTCSCWMVADPRQGQQGAVGAARIAEALRHWMGTAMQEIKVPAKCAARLGQCFSSTVDAARVEQGQKEEIPDVERNGYCFSGGVGCISPDLLDKVVGAVRPVRLPEDPPITAIQVRIHGCKGVLSRNSLLSGERLQVRHSMTKFGSDHPQLEVCSTAAWIPSYLNRQVITMMDFNGVPPEVIMSKLNALVEQLQQICVSPSAARQLLPMMGGVEQSTHWSLLRMLDVCCLFELGHAGPLVDSCIYAIAQWQVTGLRQKARLLVPDGAMLMGVMDEFDLLEEGEVFVQIQRLPVLVDGIAISSPRQVITGRVLLAKHPVAHRGDVRVVTAVDPRDWLERSNRQLLLDNYVNVVVFSQRGSRPLPNMLSGSDLDGDEYMVVWDPELLPPQESQPMDYTAEKPQEVDKVTVDHLMQHFVDYAKNDNLGQISTSLIAHADQSGADCPECEQLAQLHSKAVDFPKTGLPADLTRELYPDVWPHWMEKAPDVSYHSDKILGQICDRVITHPVNEQLLMQLILKEHHTDLYVEQLQERAGAVAAAWLQRLQGWPLLGDAVVLLPAVLEVLGEYEEDLAGMMKNWGVRDVGELLTGCIPRLQVNKSQHHQQSEEREQLNRELRLVRAKARRACLGLLLHLADQRYLSTHSTGSKSSSSSSTVAGSSNSSKLAFDYSNFQLESSTGTWSDLKPKELETAFLQQQQAPHVAAAAAAVAVSCLLAASDIRVDSKLQQQVVLQLRGQGATHAAADVEELYTGEGDTRAGVSDTELDSYTDDAESEAAAAAAAAAATADNDSADASDTEADGGLGAAALLRLSREKLSEVELLVHESFQMVMSRELLGVVRQLQQP